MMLLAVWWRFGHIIKMMAHVGSILNNDEFFVDTADKRELNSL